jgi:TonB family protein
VQPIRGIVLRCLEADPTKRCTVSEIRSRIAPQAIHAEAGPIADDEPKRKKTWMIVAAGALALALVVWFARSASEHEQNAPDPNNSSAAATDTGRPPGKQSTTVPAATTPVTTTAPIPAVPQAHESPTTPPVAVPIGNIHGSVSRRVMPEVSRNALRTITGHVKVEVHVRVDDSGRVTDAKLISAGPSAYFASRARAAVEKWKFDPPQEDGKAGTSEWIVRFQFSRSGTEVSPTEIKP